MEVSFVQPPVRDLYGDHELDGRVGGGGATRNVDVKRQFYGKVKCMIVAEDVIDSQISVCC